MKIFLLYIALLLVNINVWGQELTVSIELNRGELTNIDWGMSKDTLYITTRIKNTGSNTVLFRNAHQFYVKYREDESTGWEHCFKVHSMDKFESRIKPDYERDYDNFIEIKPGEEIISERGFSIGWLCRGAPPKRPWKLHLYYYREITPEDNHYLFKSYYTEKYEKVFVDAWTGKLVSNNIEITVE